MNDDSLKLENYVEIVQNNSHTYLLTDIVNICKRRNNTKRDFLFVNSLQGKHLHVEPFKSFALYNALIEQIKKSVALGEKVIIIGFAETATAISHYIASSLPNCIYYMQTTREDVRHGKLLLEFKEEHSHATEQLLYGELEVFKACTRIIFVDDEISTGNTILNFISELQKIGIHTKFSVASILNLQNDEWSSRFRKLGIECFYIIRGKLKDLNAKVYIEAPVDASHYEKLNVTLKPIVLQNNLSNFTVERSGSRPIVLHSYEETIYSALQEVIYELLPNKDESVLVLGTEEYMFTPMVLANQFHTNLGAKVQFHATTRSPIEVSKSSSYAIKSRYSIASCYDKSRNTFVYNLQRYDKVFIITDVIPNEEFVKDISSALIHVGCDIRNINIIVFKG